MQRRIAFLVLSLAAAVMSASANTGSAPLRLRIWVKAFIPKSNPANPGYVKQVPGSPGQWMIPGPLGLECFLTDHRAFSSDANASARVTTDFVLVMDGSSATVEPTNAKVHTPGMSTQVMCETGAVIARKVGVLQTDAVGTPAVAGSKTQIVIDVAAVNPFAPSGVAPSIDYGFSFTFDRATNTLDIKGPIGLFPAVEVYAQLGSGSPMNVLNADPTAATAWGLYDFGTGIGQRQVSGSVQLR